MLVLISVGAFVIAVAIILLLREKVRDGRYLVTRGKQILYLGDDLEMAKKLFYTTPPAGKVVELFSNKKKRGGRAK